MDFEIGGFDSASFGDFDIDIEDVEVKKTRKYDRIWKVGFGGSICGKPLFHNDLVIFGSMDHYVYAVNMTTREVVWKFKGNDVFLDSSPILSENKLFIGSFDSYMYCIDVNTGHEIWKFRTGDKVNTTAFPDHGKVYFGSKDGYTYCVELETGILVWKFATGDPVTSSPVIVNEKILFGSFSGYVYCLNKESGQELWRFKTGAEIENDYPLLVKDGILYVGSFDNYLYAVGIENGNEIWRFKTGKYGNCGIPTLHNNVLYYGSRDGILYALTLEGKELWRFQTEKEIIDKGPLVHNEKIYFGAGDGNVYCLSTDGKELWRFRANGGVYTSVVLKDGVIYFGSWDCHLYAVDPNTGEELWRFQTSTSTPAFIPNPFECFEIEVTKDTSIEESITEEKYKEKKESSASLSNYAIETEYTSTSDYKSKSDYDVSLVILEENELMEELIWNSSSGILIPQASVISIRN